ncbi:hypothetical protein EB151_00030 [archaeon]|nr:hypothetical protein [archaeon]
MIRYLSRVFVAFSIFLNSLVGGKNNQTLSALQYERKRKGKFNICFLIDFIWLWEGKDHCLEAWIKWQIINNAMSEYEKLAEKYYRKAVGYEKRDTFRRF